MAHEKQLTAVRRFLKKLGFKYLPAPDDQCLVVPIRGIFGEWITLFQIVQKPAALVCTSFLPTVIPETKLSIMGTLLTELNQVHLFSKYILDMQNRRITIRTSTFLTNNLQIPEVLCLETFQVNLITVDTFFPVLAKIISGNLTAEEALHVLTNGPMKAHEESIGIGSSSDGFSTLSGLN